MYVCIQDLYVFLIFFRYVYKLCDFYFSVENYIEVVFMFFRRVDDFEVRMN